MRINDGAVDWEQNMRSAQWTEHNRAMRDFHDINNALGEGPSKPGAVNLEMRWNRGGEKKRITDKANGFALEYRLGELKMSWSGATQGDGSFMGPSLNRVDLALMGRERNGKFFDD
jgi:hypothetical protein